MSKRTIPVVDLQHFIEGEPSVRAEFVTELGKAFHEVGFVGVVNHGVPAKLVDDFYASAKRFFNMPVSVKKNYEVAGLAGQRGYTSFGKEHAKQSEVADLKEFFQIGQTVSADDPLKSQYPDNVKVTEEADFFRLGNELYRAFEKSGRALLEAIAIYLDLGDDYFTKNIEKGNSILRAIHYPPITREPETAIRA